MIVQHNIASLNTYRYLSGTGKKTAKNLEKLSSGYKINRSGDNAAGLAISEKMRAQITGLDQAERNAKDGISLIQTAEGALTEVHDMLNRLKHLAIQASNATYSDLELKALDDELQQLKTEVNRIGETANFNGIPLFQAASSSSQAPTTQVINYNITLDLTNQTYAINQVTFSGMDGASSTEMTEAIPSGYQQLANTIATEYFPNAISQILTAFPSLENAVDSNTVDMNLEIGYIDGASSTLAYAGYSVGTDPNTGKAAAFNMHIKVDSADFSDASLQDPAATEKLESTLAHELMHSVMQYTMADKMPSEFPTWFKEGTAQLAGGGFPTNWNYALEAYAKQMSGAGDNSQDTNIANYLQSYTVAGRPYGHGYLAAAYLGYLANGGTGAVDGTSIANGMDKIFADILAGDSLYDAISKNTNNAIQSEADLEALFSSADPDLVDFVRELSYNTKGGSNDGAGSVITSSLSDGGNAIIGNTTGLTVPFEVASYTSSLTGRPESTGTLQLLIGAYDDEADVLDLDLFQMDTDALALTSTDLLSYDNARTANGVIIAAINRVSHIRSYYGAVQNRLEHTIDNLNVMHENTTSAESGIRDTDIAEAMMEYTRNSILMQSGQAMLAQANQVPNSVLSLIGAS